MRGLLRCCFLECARPGRRVDRSARRRYGDLVLEIATLEDFVWAAHVSNAARRVAYWMAENQGLEFVEILEPKDLGAMVRSSDTHGISEGDLNCFRVADMVLRATDPDGSECYVAVELCYTANGRDARRAVRNAQLLTRFTGLRADAVVAGVRFDNRILEAVESGAVAWFKLHHQLLEVR